MYALIQALAPFYGSFVHWILHSGLLYGIPTANISIHISLFNIYIFDAHLTHFRFDKFIYKLKMICLNAKRRDDIQLFVNE